jgi:UDP-3-O-[3-hydroxymyristoyl] N-acetylglucosamine deacetylase
VTRRTIAREIATEGIALHAGSTVRMTLAPASAGAGIRFRRGDLGSIQIPARFDRVSETRLGTVISESNGVTVGVIEHLMAALAGSEIDDLLVTLDGPEPPILDGDALSFLALIDSAGVQEARGSRSAIRVLKRIEVSGGDASAALVPAASLAFDFEIEFPSAAIGTQRFAWQFSTDSFRREIAPARTFGFMHELAALNKAGLARGASLENTLAIEGDRLVNPSLMRYPDEFVRHKILDALGDLALAGAPIIGRFEGRRSGHALNNALLRALFAGPANYEIVDPS